ncbi:NAD(P)H-dependent glycerol-3-phosphate dehydrogenase [Pectinatus brassicae]|uniref:Glycerol-3-phosphate dehydrogenase n=1 Tax=Pectinatus brassicae TaxID=862415 RepID=A0A840UNL5_9FIRM|nr:NAD(P)H-dependent glycerol-3-phosphate dehydrogenase [Pectinatus brassicae]MBB5335812.1 glycerol-3-phosphate dehydrogenase (NAD(P)+) [Pectinatus brassicae]
MAKITIIGAGAMGSAFTKPLADNGNDVRLWGTHLDDFIIDAVKAGKNHPKHNFPLPPSVKAFYHQELNLALQGTDIIIMAITSDALGDVFESIVPYLKSDMIIGSVTKGFNYNKDNKIVLLPEILSERLPTELKNSLDFVFVAGPCKAIEVLWGVPTAVTYASTNINAANKLRQLAQTNVYNINTTDDVIGTEICAAMKNAYCVGLGMAEGFPKQKDGFLHKNTKGALFTYAVAEMGILSQALGGTLGPVLGLPGIGDLELTGEAGRNRTLGEAIGTGLSASQAILKMKENDITVEGYPAIKFGYYIMKELESNHRLDSKDMPLLTGLYHILYEDASGYENIKKLVTLCTAGNNPL